MKEHGASKEAAQPDGLCAFAYASARKDEQSGHLREARDLLLTCAKPTCGSFLFKECAARATQLDTDIPSVVPLADDGGVPLVDVRVTMDGSMLTSHLDGRSIPVDPGLHEFSFSTDSGVFATQRVMVAQGQRNRPITVSMQSGGSARLKAASVTQMPPDGSPAAPQLPDGHAPEVAAPSMPNDRPQGRRSVFPFVLGGMGLAAAGAGALLVYWGHKDNDALTQCSPNCLQSSVDHIRTLYVAGDVAMGVGLAALGVATWRFFAGSRSIRDEAPTQAAYLFGVQSTRSGAFASVSRSF